MSKEATGENGAVLGSSDYWNRVNRATFFGTLMQRPSETNYHETLREVGNRAGAAVEEIYDDLQEHINVIRIYPLIEGAHLPSRYNRYMMYEGCPAVFAAIAVTA